MRTISSERKESILNKVLSNPDKPIAQIAAEEGIVKSTLYTWVQRSKSEGSMVKRTNTSKNKLSSEQKFMHVLASSSLDEEALSGYCREHGFYPEDIASWRISCLKANATSQEKQRISKIESKEDKKRIKALEKELKRKEKALAETAALLVLRKKLNAYYLGEEEEA